MGRKNKFRNRNRNKNVSGKKRTEVEARPEKPKKEDRRNDREYDVKAEFINAVIIILLFIGALVGLYYYDLQTNIIETALGELTKMF